MTAPTTHIANLHLTLWTKDDMEHASCQTPSICHDISVHMSNYAPSIRQIGADSPSYAYVKGAVDVGLQ